jgi:hypothetical protein
VELIVITAILAAGAIFGRQLIGGTRGGLIGVAAAAVLMWAVYTAYILFQRRRGDRG